ncbi:MAG: YggS family pyridoxal phosphate-dependent enzyme [Prevotellaceae bacterium]|jgi:pyridoxal phosphate enzyme (YggS family)|nr:YggS family pyridoxal phosphate-dependent enzyme [Prevotellaceae bacterium]
MSVSSHLATIRRALPEGVRLVCVSKFQSCEAILEAYEAGERDFAESRAQELFLKAPQLPPDIRWHFIGPIQRNKIKLIAPIACLTHSIENTDQLLEFNTQATKLGITSRVLLEVHIAQETNKHGFSADELERFFEQKRWTAFPSVQICGVMGIATQTDNQQQIATEFDDLARLFLRIKNIYLDAHFSEISMGMSDDFPLAIARGSTMIRIGSAIFSD